MEKAGFVAALATAATMLTVTAAEADGKIATTVPELMEQAANLCLLPATHNPLTLSWDRISPLCLNGIVGVPK